MIPKGLLPPDLMDCAFIAGGYAACPPLANDIDLWIYCKSEDQIPDIRDRVLDWLDTQMFEFEPQASAVAPVRYEANFTHKAAIVRSKHLTHPIHILLTHLTPEQLLETFDISTHQVAIVFGNVIKGKGWTPVTVPPVELRNTVTTLARMLKLAARYGHARTQGGI